MGSTGFGIVLGILVGLRHAFEPDHLTAVSTLVTETHSPRQGALLGIAWGLGHTISLVVVGVILTLVGAALPERAGVAFELCVAVMLMVLGARAIVVARKTYSDHDRSRDLVKAGHLHVHAVGRSRVRSLVVGLVHGLAGSGALTALVFARLDGTTARIVYMTLFGAGSVVGMAIASGVAGATLGVVARSKRVRMQIGVATGLVSISVGLLWGIPLLL